ncbi:MAG: ABC transporter permease [Vicinamibacterales bacterium]
MTAPPLPRLVTAVLARLAPRRDAGLVLADLAQDYAVAVATRGAARARWWLAREAASLAAAYAGAALRRHAARAPVGLARDLQLAARALRRRPVGSLGAAVMLACGLAAVAGAVGMADALLFRPISPVHGERLRRLAWADRDGQPDRRFSWAELERLAPRLSAATGAVNLQPIVLRDGSTLVQGLGEVVTAGYASLVGMETVVGRGLLAGDDRPGAPPVAVVSEAAWRTRLGADPTIVGRAVTINATSVTVVGVARDRGSSAYFGASVDAWLPTAAGDAMLNPGWRTNPDDRWWVAVALPAPGRDAAFAAQLASAAGDLRQAFPGAWRDRRLLAEPGLVLTGSQRAPAVVLSAVLAALAGLILLAAAANVAGLLLARAAAERRQAAVHMAIGAGRLAIMRRRILEGALIGAAGGVIAAGLYAWARRAVSDVALQPTLTLRVDLPAGPAVVLGLSLAGVLAGVLLAVAPAAWAIRVDLAGALRDGMARNASAALPRVRGALVSAQVALSLALIVCAALLARSVDGLATADAGFARAGLVAMDFDVEPAVPDAATLPALARDALARTRALPGVTGAAMASRAPVDPSTPTTGIRRPGDTARAADATWLRVTDGYLDTVGIPLVAGRDITAAEAERGADVAVVNETLAARLWEGGDAIGRALVLDGPGRTLQVVGVARDARYLSLSEPGGLNVYVPEAPQFGLALIARTSGDERRALAAIQAALDEVGPGVIGFFPRTLEDHLALELLPGRAAAGAATALGAVALALSAMGLYGLVAWFVEVRRREIGVRMALGASPGDVRRLIVGQAFQTAIPGIVIGLGLSVALALAARSALPGVTPLDPIAIAAGAAAISGVVLAASYAPTRRATRIDPALVIRE